MLCHVSRQGQGQVIQFKSQIHCVMFLKIPHDVMSTFAWSRFNQNRCLPVT